MKWFTRKNSWYMGSLILVQLGLGVWLLARPEPDLFWGGFMMWCCGVNMGYACGNSPDFF